MYVKALIADNEVDKTMSQLAPLFDGPVAEKKGAGDIPLSVAMLICHTIRSPCYRTGPSNDFYKHHQKVDTHCFRR